MGLALCRNKKFCAFASHGPRKRTCTGIAIQRAEGASSQIRAFKGDRLQTCRDSASGHRNVKYSDNKFASQIWPPFKTRPNVAPLHARLDSARITFSSKPLRISPFDNMSYRNSASDLGNIKPFSCQNASDHIIHPLLQLIVYTMKRLLFSQQSDINFMYWYAQVYPLKNVLAEIFIFREYAFQAKNCTIKKQELSKEGPKGWL